MIISWFEYEFRLREDDEWRRGRFDRRADLGFPEAPVGKGMAHEMLTVIAPRWKPEARLRLVKITEERFEGEEVKPGSLGIRDDGEA